MKHWFMTQVWRFQQIAMIATLALMMVNLSLTLYKYVQWRIPDPYIGLPMLVFALLLMVWISAWYYDRKLKLWREQMMVAVDRNPYAQDRLTPKEIINMEWIWIPIVNHADPQTADKLRQWVQLEKFKYPEVAAQVEVIKGIIQ